MDTSSDIGRREHAIPRPFASGWFPADRRHRVDALWGWIEAVSVDPDRFSASLSEISRDADRITRGDRPRCIRSAVHEPVHAAMLAGGVDPAVLADRLRAIVRLRSGPPPQSNSELAGLLEDLVHGHAAALAGLAGLTGSWQRSMAVDLARGFMLVGWLVQLPRSAAGGVVLVPEEDLDRFGVSEDGLRGSAMPQGFEPVAWKTAVRARDFLASGRAVMGDLPFVMRVRARSWWCGALELLLAAERRNWDVWKKGPDANLLLRSRSRIAAVFGRSVRA